MKKMILTILASLSLASACAVAETTYVVDSSGNPVKTGDKCVVAAGSGTQFDECGGGAKMAKQTAAAAETMMKKPTAMAKPMMKKAAGTKYVADSNGKPVMVGDQCVVAGGNGTHFDECGGGMADAADASMAKQAPAPAPKPRVITKVIVDCAKCPK